MMLGMDGWDLVLCGVASYFAVTTLSRLMRNQRNRIVDDLAKQAESDRMRLEARKKRERRQNLRRQLHDHDAI